MDILILLSESCLVLALLYALWLTAARSAKTLAEQADEFGSSKDSTDNRNLKHCWQLYNDGDDLAAQATEALLETIGESPRRARALYLLGLIHIRDQRLKDAEGCLQSALPLAENFRLLRLQIDLRNALAHIYHLQRDGELCTRQLEKVIALCEESMPEADEKFKLKVLAPAYLNLASLYSQLQFFRDALKCAQQAQEILAPYPDAPLAEVAEKAVQENRTAILMIQMRSP